MVSLQSGAWHRSVDLLASTTAKIGSHRWATESASLTNSPDDSNLVRNTGMKPSKILPLSLVAPWSCLQESLGTRSCLKGILPEGDGKGSSSFSPFRWVTSHPPLLLQSFTKHVSLPKWVRRWALHPHRQVWVVQGAKVGFVLLASRMAAISALAKAMEGWKNSLCRRRQAATTWCQNTWVPARF